MEGNKDYSGGLPENWCARLSYMDLREESLTHQHTLAGSAEITATVLAAVLMLLVVGIGGVVTRNRALLPSTPKKHLRESPTPLSSSTNTAKQTDLTATWNLYSNTQHGYSLRYPRGWTVYWPRDADGQVLDHVCFGDKMNKCLLSISVLDSSSWGRRKRLLGLTISSSIGTERVSLAGQSWLKKSGQFNEDEGSPQGFIMILSKETLVYEIWAYTQPKIKQECSYLIDASVASFEFTR